MSSAIDLLIVGSGPAAVSAARSYRDHDGPGRVVMVTDDPDAPYDRPPLSKDFLRGETTEADLFLLEQRELEKLEVELRSGRVVGLSPAEHQVTVDGDETLTYRWCLLATGSTPAVLPIPGGDDPGLLYLRTLQDARRLRSAATADGAKSAVVVGSGFIGCEAAVSLRRLGLAVTLVTDEEGPQRKRLGEQASARIAGWLRDEGVRLLTGVTLTSIDVEPEATTVQLQDGDDVRADLVLMAVGVTPVTDLADAAGLPRHEGRVTTDAAMRTPMDGVLAAGDIAMAFNTAAGRPLAVEHWGEAETMGRIAGATAAGAQAQWDGVPGFWSQIGERTLQYAAWGDGFEQARLVEHGEKAFTVWYTDRSGNAVGVLTFGVDDDYENGQSLITKGTPPPA